LVVLMTEFPVMLSGLFVVSPFLTSSLSVITFSRPHKVIYISMTMRMMVF
jgi:hypothetical protein